MSKHVNIPLSDDLYRKIKVWAAENGVTMSEAGRALLEALVSGNGYAAAVVSEATGKPISKKR